MKINVPQSPLLAHRFRWRGVAACRLTGAERKFAAGRQLGGLRPRTFVSHGANSVRPLDFDGNLFASKPSKETERRAPIRGVWGQCRTYPLHGRTPTYDTPRARG